MIATRVRGASLRAAALMAALGGLAFAAPATAAQAPTDYTKVQGLSQPVHEIERTSHDVEMADGINLYVEVVKPKGGGSYPVILEASPYHGTLADRDGTRIFPDPVGGEDKKLGLTGYFAPRGYAVVMVDLRGTGRSEGCLDHLGPDDASDLKAIVEWAATQPWSTGRVGMTGHSYVGSTPSVAAAQNPKGLVTIAPSAGLASMYDHQFQHGVPYYLQYVGPMVAYEQLAIERHLPGEDNFGQDMQYFGCGAPNSAATAGSGQATGQYEAWHRERDWRQGAAAADIPVFMIHGVNDNAARIPAAEWFFKDRYAGEVPGEASGGPAGETPKGSGKKSRKACKRKARGKGKAKARGKGKGKARGKGKAKARGKGKAKARGKGKARKCPKPTKRKSRKRAKRSAAAAPQARIHDKVWLGQWDHGSGGATRCAETGSGGHPNCRFEQWQFALHAWFDKTLQRRDVDTGPAVEVFLNDELVHTDTRWRPTNGPLTLHADTDGELSETRGEDSSASFQAAPTWDPGTYVDFRSEPLTQRTTFVGLPQVQLAASTTGPVQLVATLLEENAQGELDLQSPVTVCAIQPLLRDGIDKVTPIVPGQRMAMVPQCFTAAHVVDAGERLVLRVSAAHRETGSHHAPTMSGDARVTVYTGNEGTTITVPRALGAQLHPDPRPSEG